MDEMLLLRMTGGLGAGLDVPALLAFIAFAVIYFLAPVVTHSRERPTALALSLYLMIGYAGLALIQWCLQWLEISNGLGGNFGMPARQPMAAHLLFAFVALKMVLFLFAMIAFVV